MYMYICCGKVHVVQHNKMISRKKILLAMAANKKLDSHKFGRMHFPSWRREQIQQNQKWSE